MSRAATLVLSTFLLATAIAACGGIPPDPIRLERGMLTVENQTGDEWRNVEIWINRYFRVTVPSIAAGGRLQVPVNAFVSGYGQRFDPAHMLLNELRLNATAADGAPVALSLEDRSGLKALKGKT